MRGVGVIEFGGPDVLRIVDLPEVHAGPGEVRLRVHAATVNPTDTGLRDGSRAERMKSIDPPYIPGRDAAGVIDEVGPDTDTDLAVGDAVMAMVVPVGAHGAYRESCGIPPNGPPPPQSTRSSTRRTRSSATVRSRRSSASARARPR